MARPRSRSSSQVAILAAVMLVVIIVLAALGAVAAPTSPTGLAGPGGNAGGSGVAAAPTGHEGPSATSSSASGSSATTGPAWGVAFLWHVPVLMYHLVATPAEAGDALPGLVVPPALFAAQMTLLHAAGWRTITAATLAHDMAAGTAPPPRTFVVTFDDGHVDGYTEAFPVLQALGFVATYYVPTRRIGEPGYLSEAQLATLAASGMEIADHTVDHVPLATASPRVAVAEIGASAAAIRRDLGSAPVTFAYPYGSHDAAVIGDVRSAGFLIAFTNDEGCLEAPGARFVLPRLRVSPSTSPTALLDRLQAYARMPAWG